MALEDTLGFHSIYFLLRGKEKEAAFIELLEVRFPFYLFPTKRKVDLNEQELEIFERFHSIYFLLRGKSSPSATPSGVNEKFPFYLFPTKRKAHRNFGGLDRFPTLFPFYLFPTKRKGLLSPAYGRYNDD